MDVSTYPKINQNYKRGDYAECITLSVGEPHKSLSYEFRWAVPRIHINPWWNREEVGEVRFQYKKDAVDYYQPSSKAIEQRGYYIDLTESSRTNWTAQDEVKHSLRVN